jgi:hypothetical protein
MHCLLWLWSMGLRGGVAGAGGEGHTAWGLKEPEPEPEPAAASWQKSGAAGSRQPVTSSQRPAASASSQQQPAASSRAVRGAGRAWALGGPVGPARAVRAV